MSTALPPAERADDAIRAVLHAHWEGEPALIVDAPPGAGKSWLVTATAAQAAGELSERCVIVTQTNEQAFDLAERFGTMFPRLGVTLLCREGLLLPDRASFRRAPIQVIDSPRQIPTRPCVVVANAKKLVQSRIGAADFDTMIVDEAYQLPNHEFLGLAPLAYGLVLVGDPGQIAPVIRCPTTRWVEDLAGPHVSAPAALLATHSEVRRITMPVSRRLVQDTVDILQPAFYHDLRFTALDSHPARRLVASLSGRPSTAAEAAMDEALARAAAGISLSGVILPEAAPLTADPEVARWIAAGVMRAHEGDLTMEGPSGTNQVTPERIGVVCATKSQVRAVKALLPPTVAASVLVETANRYQGLERDLILIWHPLTGRPRTSGFYFDAGRLCVMLSRHRGACVVYGRPDIFRALDGAASAQPLPLGATRDPVAEGRAAHAVLLSVLARPERRIFSPLS